MQTIEQLTEEIEGLKEELNTAIEAKEQAEIEAETLEEKVKELEGEIEDLESEINGLKEQEYGITTVIGKMGYQCDNIPDNDTMELVVELMKKVRPADLQDHLKRLLAGYDNSQRAVETLRDAA